MHKFTPSNGNISCSIKQKIKDKDKIKIEFEVSDTGIGMSEEQLKIIFQAFTQANTQQLENLVEQDSVYQ